MLRTFSRSLLFVLILLVIMVGLAGCGGKKDPTPEPAAAEAAAPAEPALVGDATAGKNVYVATCQACHGPDAKGIQGLGKSLHPSDSEFVSTKTDAELVEYIKVGRRVDDPLNTTGVDMPPKGGNPAMSEQEMYNVVAYLRTLE
ncbi:MAG: cytochrome c [Caldilineaceae bacterium]